MLRRSAAFLLVACAWLCLPSAARAQEALMNCKIGTFKADDDAEERSKVQDLPVEIWLKRLLGHVAIKCNDMQIFADEIELRDDSDDIIARGHVLFQQPGISINADKAVMNRKTHLGAFFNVTGSMKLHDAKPEGDLFGGLEADAFFSAERLDKTGLKKYHIENGRLTTCTQPTPRWDMAFSGTIVPGKHIFMRDMVLRVKDVPLFYLPAFYLPTDKDGRSTGFLMPQPGGRSTTGFTISNAFFWVLGRSQDITFFHNYFSKTGQGVGTEYRYVQAPGSNGNVQFTALLKRAQTNSNGDVTVPSGQDYRLVGSLNQRLPMGFRLIARTNYFTSLSTEQTYQQNVLDFSTRTSNIDAELSNVHGPYNFRLTFERNDTYTGLTSVTRTGSLPRFDFSIGNRPIGRSKIYFSFKAQSGYFLRQDALNDPTRDHSLWRTDVMPTLNGPIGRLSFLTMQGFASWRFTRWSESTTGPNQPNVPSPITRQLFETRLEVTGPKFYRIYQGSSTGFAERYKHLIQPSVSIGWNSPFSRFANVVQQDPSIDALVGGSANISYGVTNIIQARRRTGPPPAPDAPAPTVLKDIVTVSVSQRWNSNLLASAYAQQDLSSGLYNPPATSLFTPIDLRATVTPTDLIRSNFSLHYDTHFKAVRDYGAGATITQPLASLSVGWHKTQVIPGLTGYDNPAAAYHTLDLTTSLTRPDKRLGGTYGMYYDMKHGILQQQRIVVYYNSQCCGVSFDYQTLAASTFQPADRRFGFSFTLAGLGSFANPFGSFGGGGVR